MAEFEVNQFEHAKVIKLDEPPRHGFIWFGRDAEGEDVVIIGCSSEALDYMDENNIASIMLASLSEEEINYFLD